MVADEEQVVLVGGGAGRLTTLMATAADEKKADEKEPTRGAKTKSFEDKEAKTTDPAAINFGKTLGLAFDSLTTLGSRIATSQKNSDPVGLASSAMELAV